MTLVLTIIKDSGIWQSADYRLTLPETGTVVTDTSVKQFVDRPYPEGGGCSVIAYTGLGRLPGEKRPVSEWLVRTLRGEQRPIFDSLGVIAELATQRIGASQPHWFIAAGFLDGEPWYAQVSNMAPNSVLGRDRPSSDFKVYRWELPDRCAIIAPSQGLILDDDLEKLRRVTALETDPRDPDEFLDLLGAITRRTHEAGQETVSPFCSSIFVPAECEPSHTKVHGDNPDLRGPYQLFAGVDLSETMELLQERMRAMKRENDDVSDEEWDRRFEEAAERSVTPETDSD